MAGGVPASVPAASRDAPRGPAKKILLGTDLSAASSAATEEAFRLARQDGAELLVVSVIDPDALRLPGGRFLARVDQVRERRESAARELVERARAHGLVVSLLVWVGDPAESLIDAAMSEGADLIVLGSHGRGPIGRLFLGSVSRQVLRDAPVPVVVVPRSEHGSE